MKEVFWNYFLLLIIPMFLTSESKAQSYQEHPLKFNKDFSGIGPRVYILPPPKTEQEVLEEKYADKKKEQADLLKILDQLKLENRLIKTDNGQLPQIQTDSIQTSKEKQILAAINYYKQRNLKDSVTAWQNQLGIHQLLQDNLVGARKTFNQVLSDYHLSADQNNERAVLQNLAILEEESQDYIMALTYYDQLLTQAIKSKNIKHQGLINLSIAQIEAKMGNYAIAHNLVIKKSFPLLKRTKYYPDVVIALNLLAGIKESEEKLIEAKWIYLQAIDVATIHKDEKGMAISFYNLAKLKATIGDEILAIEDYKSAEEFALKNQMASLLLEIEDGIGDAYLSAGKYKEAMIALNSYHVLKTEFISNQSLL